MYIFIYIHIGTSKIEWRKEKYNHAFHLNLDFSKVYLLGCSLYIISYSICGGYDKQNMVSCKNNGIELTNHFCLSISTNHRISGDLMRVSIWNITKFWGWCHPHPWVSSHGWPEIVSCSDNLTWEKIGILYCPMKIPANQHSTWKSQMELPRELHVICKHAGFSPGPYLSG